MHTTPMQHRQQEKIHGLLEIKSLQNRITLNGGPGGLEGRVSNSKT